MSSNFQTMKYIERLVRIISQKEKLIDELRKSSKMHTNTHSSIQDEQTSMVDRRVKQELAINNLQIRLLQQKMIEMEQKLLDFSRELQEQSRINEELRLSIQFYERRQKEMSEQIAAMSDLNSKLEQNIKEYECQRIKELAKREFLELEVQQLSQKLNRYQIMQDCEVKQQQKQLKIIQAKVKNLYKIINQPPYCQGKEIDSHQSKDIIEMIDLIEEKLKKQNDQLRQDVFNDTLDGISMIVRSLECGYSLTEPYKAKKCSFAPTAILKNQVSVSQTAKQSKFQHLNKSKLQSTRLNCTSKILQDVFSE